MYQMLTDSFVQSYQSLAWQAKDDSTVMVHSSKCDQRNNETFESQLN